MLEKLSKSLKLYIAKGVFTLGTLLVVICLAVGALFGNHTFGWFSTRQDVSANGMQVAIDGFDVGAEFAVWKTGDTPNEYKTVQLENGVLPIFDDLIPGDRVYVKVTLKNNEDSAFNVSASIDPIEETPRFIDGDGYYYLGSQLRLIYDGFDNGTDASDPLTTPDLIGGYTPRFLVPNPNTDVSFTEATGEALTSVNMSATDMVGQSENGTLTFYFVIEFANFPASQNNYANFSDVLTEKGTDTNGNETDIQVANKGVCRHRLTFSFAEKTS